MSFFFPFFLLYFWFWSVLLCWAGRVGRDGLEEWEGWMGLEGEVVYYWQNVKSVGRKMMFLSRFKMG